MEALRPAKPRKKPHKITVKKEADQNKSQITKTSMKKKKTVKAWAVVTIDGDWTDQVTTEMSENLRNFYNKSKTHRVVPCTITY